jgi:hypothetical protein
MNKDEMLEGILHSLERIETALCNPTMEFKQPTKIFGPNLEQMLNAAGFYRHKGWVGLTHDERYLDDSRTDEEIEYAKGIEALLKEKNT